MMMILGYSPRAFSVLGMLTVFLLAHHTSSFFITPIVHRRCTMAVELGGGTSGNSKATSISSKDGDVYKEKIKSIGSRTNKGLTANDAQKDSVKEAVAQLVKINPTEAIATSSLADGDWRLVYTTTKGSSAGKLGPFAGDVVQSVWLKDKLYANYVTVGPVQGKLEATWEVMDPNEWEVQFLNIAFTVFGAQLFKIELKQVGVWSFLFLDDDFRILSARNKNINEGNLYILERVKKAE